MAERKNKQNSSNIKNSNQYSGGKLLKKNPEKEQKYRSEFKPRIVAPTQPRQRPKIKPVKMSVRSMQAQEALASKSIARRPTLKSTRVGADVQLLGNRRRPNRRVRRGKKRGKRRKRSRVGRSRQGTYGGGGKWDVMSNLPQDRRTSWETEPEKHEDNWIDKFMDVAPDLVSHVLPLVLGAGDYSDPDSDILATGERPTSNSLLACATDGKVGGEVPYMHADGNETRIQHREYIGDVYSTTDAYKTQTFDLNPGLNETNPWLAPIANQFAAYRYLGMNYEFVSEGSEYTNSAGLGYVALATQYNAYTPNFTDKRSMLNSQFADAAKPSKSFAHWIECKPGSVPLVDLYTRAGSTPANADRRLYDLGRVTLAVGGNTADNAVIGELWATYDVELLLPKTSDTTGESLNYSSGTAYGATGATPFGGGVVTFSANSTFKFVLGVNTIAFPNSLRGIFNITWYWNGTAAVFNPNAMTASNCTFSGGVTNGPQFGLAGVTTAFYNRSVLLTKDNASISIGGGGTVPVGYVITTITQVPQDPPTQSGIFDKGGLNRQRCYEEYMKKYHRKNTTSELLDPSALLSESSDEDEEVVVLKETDSFGLELSLITGDYMVYDANDIPFPYSLPNSEVKVNEEIAKKLLMLRSDEEFDNTIKLIIIEHNEFRTGKQ